jgi:hypothetical protein
MLLTKVVLPGEGGLMADENVGAPRTGPLRIVRMSIAPDPRGVSDGPLTIVAHLDPAPDREELPWWMEQLRDRVRVCGWLGTSTGLTNVQVEAPSDQLEAVARRLVTAVEEANAAYPDSYAAWRREHDDRVAEERRREERRSAARQAILDRVLDEYRRPDEGD